MIKYNDYTISEWYLNDASIVKVYKNGAVCYYRISESGGQTPCFAVVDNISQYQDTEFEDVYNNADNKWYKLNNLNLYEEYGVYGSGRTITHYEGKLTIDDGYEYEYSGNAWVNIGEVSGSTATLPNVPFMVNYNAKDYDAANYTLKKTSGQSRDVDAVCNYGYGIVDHSEDGYITVTANTRMNISGTPYFGRNNTQTGCTMTIVSKVKTTNATASYSILTNRGNTNTNQMNWMWRYPSNAIFLHGSSSYNNPFYSVSTTGQPITASIKTYYDGGVKQQLKDWTNNGNYSGNFQYGSEYNGNSSLFCDYNLNNGEFWKGDFYWVYMSQNVLTDEQIQQVIDYNEANNIITYPKYYDDKSAPEDNVVFADMAEAEAYQCPWVGMRATIGGDSYVFSGDSTSGYEWVLLSLPYDAEIEYLESDGSSYIDTGIYLNTSNFEVGLTQVGAGLYNHWGYTHQNVVNGTWITTEYDYAFFGTWATNNRVVISSYLTSGDNTIIYTQSGVTVNGTTLSKNLNIGSDSISNVTVPVFACYNFDVRGIDYSENYQLKSFYIKNNGTLVVDMIPVRVGQVGYMYDRVSGQLFGNQGSGDFILGNDKQHDYSEDYLTFVAETDNVFFQLAGGVNGNTFQYSIDDGSTWNNVSIGQTTSSINAGDKMMFKATSLSIGTETGIGTIRPSGSASVEGNIMSLVYGDNFVGQTSISNNFQLRKLFSGATNITSAENMVLPATTFTKQCYSQMFQGCTNLTTPPKAVGTETATFNGVYCFSDMFNSCTSLTKAPELPMTALGTQCYWYMFQGCTSLTASPLLEAPTINTQSYAGMFNGCTSLNSITCLATAGISTNNCNSWVTNVPSGGTFVKAASASWSTGTSGVPSGWSVIDNS